MKTINRKTCGQPPDSVYIGRGSPWGNPFVIGRDGDREAVIRQFEIYARDRLKTEPQWLDPLRGKDLVCFCAPLPCHGDVIIILLEEMSAARNSKK